VDFPGIGLSYLCREGAKVHFHHSKLRNYLFCKKVMGKCQILKSWVSLDPPSDAHDLKTSYDKKAEDDHKNVFSNRHIMIFENNIH